MIYLSVHSTQYYYKVSNCSSVTSRNPDCPVLKCNRTHHSDTNMEPYFLSCCLTPIAAAVDSASKCDAEKRLVCIIFSS